MCKPVFAIIALLLTLVGHTATAQESTYKKFKVDLSSGYSRPSETISGNTSGGLNLSLESKYNVTDQIAVGIKFEGAALASVSLSGSKSIVNVVSSTSLTGEYYFGSKTVRPYLGLGLGFYKSQLLNSDDGFKTISTGDNVFGFAPRAGLQISHFRLGLEYNLVQNSNFFSTKIGTTIGGGRR